MSVVNGIIWGTLCLLNCLMMETSTKTVQYASWPNQHIDLQVCHSETAKIRPFLIVNIMMYNGTVSVPTCPCCIKLIQLVMFNMDCLCPK